MTTQRKVVEQLLRQHGRVGAHELTYQHGITRAAAIVHRLRQDGWQISTEGGHGDQAVYVLDRPRPRPAPPPAPPPLGAGGTVTWEELRAKLQAGQARMVDDASERCQCHIDADEPSGVCPYCHHREHGSAGCGGVRP